MTVADIKEYIDNAIDTAFAQKIAIDTAQILKKALIDTKGFLDELEPTLLPNKQILWERDMAIKQLNDLGFSFGEEVKAKRTNNMNGTFTCSRCGAKRPNDNYCGNCGAIMREPKESEQ